MIEVEIPNYKEPIRLALRAELPENSPEAEGLVIVDDIRLQVILFKNSILWKFKGKFYYVFIIKKSHFYDKNSNVDLKSIFMIKIRT
jgi:hypothetical protein